MEVLSRRDTNFYIPSPYVNALRLKNLLNSHINIQIFDSVLEIWKTSTVKNNPCINRKRWESGHGKKERNLELEGKIL